MRHFVVGFLALSATACSNCSCTLTPFHVAVVTAKGEAMLTSSLHVVPDRDDLVLDAPTCSDTDAATHACRQWALAVHTSVESLDGPFTLVGNVTTEDGHQLPLTVQLAITNAGDVCCGAVVSPVDSTVTAGT